MNALHLPLSETEDIVLVRDSARALLQAQWPAARAVALASQPSELRRLWQSAAAQGWTALGIDDAELGLPAALALMQELGRAACPLPLMDSVLAQAVLGASPERESQDLLARIQSGAAVPTWIFGPADEDSGFELHAGTPLQGRASFVENTAIATHFLVVTGRPGEVAIVERDAAGVQVSPTPGLAVPSLADVRFEGVRQFAFVRSTQALEALGPLARLLLAARATGSAQVGLELLTDYAKVRSQFGKKIGQYQAIQHKLADCFTGVEICRLALQRAGAAPATERIYAAAVAAANAGDLLRQVVLELHHGFGGISFWHEHELPRHFHRIHGDLTRLGGVRRARRDVAATLIARGTMPSFSYGPKADAFRGEVNEWLAANWDHTYPPETWSLPANERKARQDFSRKLGAKGWLGITWPRAYGGQERTALEHLAFEEEMAYSEAPVTFHNTSANMMGPTLVHFGSSQQKQALLPRIASGEISFALGYSEPDNGSDLAGLRTSARRASDGGWIINGQKIFTSAAAWATYVWLAARTDPEQPRHGGISVFVVPMNAPGISKQRMLGLNDHSSFVVFYDDVKVPAEALVGEENGGWKIITEALAYERVTLGAIGARARGYFDKLLAHVRVASRGDRPMADDSWVLDLVGALGAEVEAARLLAVRTAQVVEQGDVPTWEAAMLKVYASELMERLSEAAFDLLGTGATLKHGSDSAVAEGAFEYGVRDALLFTIGGGTNEIQRTLIALRGLDLPR